MNKLSKFLQALKKRLALKKVNITKEQAVEIAKKTCIDAGFQWNEPISVGGTWGTYEIWTNLGYRGNNFWAHIDGHDGKVLDFGLTGIRKPKTDD